MRGYDADVARTYLDELYLPRCTSWKGDNLRPEAAESERIVGSLKDRKLFRRRREGIYVHAVVQDNDDAGSGKADAVDRRAEFEGNDGLLFRIIPYDDLVWRDGERVVRGC